MPKSLGTLKCCSVKSLPVNDLQSQRCNTPTLMLGRTLQHSARGLWASPCLPDAFHSGQLWIRRESIPSPVGRFQNQCYLYRVELNYCISSWYHSTFHHSSSKHRYLLLPAAGLTKHPTPMPIPGSRPWPPDAYDQLPFQVWLQEGALVSLFQARCCSSILADSYEVCESLVPCLSFIQEHDSLINRKLVDNKFLL